MMVEQEDFCKALHKLAYYPGSLSNSETWIQHYRSSFYIHKECTHNLIKWTVCEQNSHLCIQSSYIFWKSGCNRNISTATKKANQCVIGPYRDACPKLVHKKIHSVLHISSKHMQTRHKTIGVGGVTFIYDLNVLWNFLFRPIKITNSRIVIRIYLSATLHIYHSEPNLGTTNAFNLFQTKSQNLTVLTLKETSKPNLSMSIKIK